MLELRCKDKEGFVARLRPLVIGNDEMDNAGVNCLRVANPAMSDKLEQPHRKPGKTLQEILQGVCNAN